MCMCMYSFLVIVFCSRVYVCTQSFMYVHMYVLMYGKYSRQLLQYAQCLQYVHRFQYAQYVQYSQDSMYIMNSMSSMHSIVGT